DDEPLLHGPTESLTAGAALLCGCNAGGESGGKTSSGAGGGAQAGSGTDSGSGGINLTVDSGGTISGSGGSADCSGGLTVIVRDFTTSNKDFEPGVSADDTGIVLPDLGADGKPVYAGNPTTPTTHGKESFDQWYRDVDGVNKNIPIKIQLTEGAGGIFTYDNQKFFPIDGQGFGDEGNPHNFHFTNEVHTKFTYKGGESFTFSGDDDLFGYVNKKLVINLGGIHSAQTKTLDLDKLADELGLKIGGTYSLDLFGAERHVTESHYRIDTTISCFVDVPPAK
ncbi:MAG: fibro-slime domain-containing protein, partial [Byssovorax sp.]